MRIVIVGAGAVGNHLAERLSIEGQDVVVVTERRPVLPDHHPSTVLVGRQRGVPVRSVIRGGVAAAECRG